MLSQASGSNSKPDVDSHEEDSLAAALHEITDIVKQLDSFIPHETKKKVGRPAKQQPPKSKSPNKNTSEPSPLHSICSFLRKIVNELGEVKEENLRLRARVELLEDSNSGGTKNLTDTSTSEHIKHIPSYSDKVTSTTSPAHIASRIDQLEQDSLSTTIKLDGELIRQKIDRFKTITTDNHPQLCQTVIEEINKVTPDIIKREDIVQVGIIGRERRHLKLKLINADIKVKLLRTFRTKTPENFYISQYLTKTRAHVLYQVKKLKKSNLKLASAYSYNGNICCKIEGNDRVHQVNDLDALSKLSKLHGLHDESGPPTNPQEQ